MPAVVALNDQSRPPAGSLGEMRRRGASVRGATPVAVVERAFLDDPALSSVVVFDPVGAPVCFTRAAFFATLTGRLGYGRAIYARRTMRDLPAPATLCLPTGCAIVDAVSRVLGRPEESRYDDFVVIADGEEPTTLCVADLFAELAHLQAFQGLHDGLTGLANRRLFLERLSDARAGGGDFAVLFIDVDGFKSINDGLGHDVGDAALVTLAQRLLAVAGDGATVARLGGDEFGIVLPRISTRVAAERATGLILSGLSVPLRTAEVRATLSASIGVAFGSDGDSSEELLRAADIAMYDAKRRARGTASFYAPAMRQAAHRRHELRLELEDALARGELTLVTQPIVALDGERTVAAEALLRWQRPGGSVSPAEFIPVCEQTGAIVPIGRWVLVEACAHAASWARSRSGTPLRISVNISPRQLQGADLAADVHAALASSGIPAWALTLEITEGVFIQDRDADAVLARLRECRGLGVTIALDDFGAGYSSLDRLARMPIDVLKLDRAFIAALDTTEGRKLAAGIVALASSLELVTVGEGIETAAQARSLREMGCQLGQGFHFARPMDPTRLLDGRDTADLWMPAASAG